MSNSALHIYPLIVCSLLFYALNPIPQQFLVVGGAAPQMKVILSLEVQDAFHPNLYIYHEISNS